MAENRSSDDIRLKQVKAAIKQAWRDGCPVAGDALELAKAALRRWRSSKRRGIDEFDVVARIGDLAEGLAKRFEPPDLVGPLIVDYRYLAERIANVIDSIA